VSEFLDISRVAILDQLGRWNGDPARVLYASYDHYPEERWVRFDSPDQEALCLH